MRKRSKEKSAPILKKNGKIDGRTFGNGRPEKPIDWELVDKLLISDCHGTEIAAHFHMHCETFYRRVQERYGMGFTEYSNEKKDFGNSLLRDKQFNKALDGDNTMLIWLGKNRMKQKEKEESEAQLQNFAKLIQAFSEGKISQVFQPPPDLEQKDS